MCFGSTKTPEVSATPVASPTPTAVEPTEVSALSQEERRKKLQKLRQGLASTIKTSPVGLSSDLMTGKTKLGQ